MFCYNDSLVSQNRGFCYVAHGSSWAAHCLCTMNESEFFIIIKERSVIMSFCVALPIFLLIAWGIMWVNFRKLKMKRFTKIGF